ncbi:MAG: S41 family peptidase [Fibromonadales bacterium]|nr:S41 family peptidase [Fibromonadales bacterium]
MRFIALLFALLLASCGEVVKPSDEEYELYYNHLLLKAYFFKPERIKPFSEYEGMEIDEMYRSLGDYFRGARYTYYLPPTKADDKISELENTPKYLSFGFERILIGDTLLVVSQVYPISPAAAAGLKKHDTLLFANGVSLTGKNAVLYKNSDSKFDSSTTFRVSRGEDIFMEKAEIQNPTVYLDSLDGIPYITVTQYKPYTNNPDGTYAEFKEILQKIKNAPTAIMDLRNNPGGHITHCTKMAAELVPFDSELIVDVTHYYDKGKGNVIDTVHYFVSDFLEREGDGVNIHWTILINGRSASCAERFVAAVKYNRPETVIAGEKSVGKGVGQMYAKTYLGGLAYITCMQSYYPNGETFHEVGIVPNNQDASVLTKSLPKHKTEEPVEFGMYEYRSLHQWE